MTGIYLVCSALMRKRQVVYTAKQNKTEGKNGGGVAYRAAESSVPRGHSGGTVCNQVPCPEGAACCLVQALLGWRQAMLTPSQTPWRELRLRVAAMQDTWGLSVGTDAHSIPILKGQPSASGANDSTRKASLRPRVHREDGKSRPGGPCCQDAHPTVSQLHPTLTVWPVQIL